MHLSNSQKITGWTTTSTVIVYKNNVPFYVVGNELLKAAKGRVNFNLPAGSYEFSKNCDTILPIRYKAPNLPAPNRKGVKLPPKINLRYGDNPNKCTVNLLTGDIFADESLKLLPESVRTFIFFHEIGHYLYKYAEHEQTESMCDKFAAREMLRKGYNPSQIFSAPRLSLSDKSQGRKECIKNFATKITK